MDTRNSDYQKALTELDNEFPGAELDESLETFLALDVKCRSIRPIDKIINYIKNLFIFINPFFVALFFLSLSFMEKLNMNSVLKTGFEFLLPILYVGGCIWNSYLSLLKKGIAHDEQ